MIARSGAARACLVETRDPLARLTVNRSGATRWPTPTVQDASRGGERSGIPERVLRSPTPVAGHNVSLQHAVRLWPGGVTLTDEMWLNPRFAEWLMGFPDQWTDSSANA